MKTCDSIGIKKALGSNLTWVGSRGEGDSKITLWRNVDGREAIETNGDPVFEGEAGFEEACAEIMAS